MYIKSTLFKKEWEQLEKYYNKTHTREESNFYYSKLKDLSDEVFLKTLDNIYNNCKYFPCIAEIREQVPNNEELKIKQWEELNHKPLDEADKEWARRFYKKYCDTKEEYHKRLIENGLETNV